MAHENAIGVIGMAEQTCITESDRGATSVPVKVLLDSMRLPHKDVRKNNCFIDSRPLLGGNDQNRRSFNKAAWFNIFQSDNASSTHAEISHSQLSANGSRLN
jgi:hypothetical protein